MEALPLRAPTQTLERLIWGKTPGGEYGIRRLSDILGQHRLKGNFLVDMAACELYGEAAVREVCDYLLSQGHEVHAHLHPELLAEAWQFRAAHLRQRRMAEMDETLSNALIEYTANRFERVTGRRPYLFRSGGYFFNHHTILAAQKAGIPALSNYNPKRHGNILPDQTAALEMKPFRWQCGVTELPVDISSPEAGSWPNFLKNFDATTQKGICNVVFHSWTLLKRNEEGHHLEFSPELEERFSEICAHLAAHTTAHGYQAYLEPLGALPSVDEGLCLKHPPIPPHSLLQCSGCGAVMTHRALVNAGCPSCGEQTHRAIPERPQ